MQKCPSGAKQRNKYCSKVQTNEKDTYSDYFRFLKEDKISSINCLAQQLLHWALQSKITCLLPQEKANKSVATGTHDW